jgi:hypothetical protein
MHSLAQSTRFPCRVTAQLVLLRLLYVPLMPKVMSLANNRLSHLKVQKRQLRPRPVPPQRPPPPRPPPVGPLPPIPNGPRPPPRPPVRQPQPNGPVNPQGLQAQINGNAPFQFRGGGRGAERRLGPDPALSERVDTGKLAALVQANRNLRRFDAWELEEEY